MMNYFLSRMAMAMFSLAMFSAQSVLFTVHSDNHVIARSIITLSNGCWDALPRMVGGWSVAVSLWQHVDHYIEQT